MITKHFETLNVVHCEWNDWMLGECSLTCGGGMLTKTRKEKVKAQFGGEECPGPHTIEESCNVQECPGQQKTFRVHDNIVMEEIFLESNMSSYYIFSGLRLE